jgi:endonuclease/exonuclease/phosphatase family metal-dependent hydrolase
VRAIQSSGVFMHVDVLLMQEVFRRFDRVGDDPLHAMCALNPALHAAATEISTPSGCFTDSGLAAVAVHPWTVRFIAAHTFTSATGVDAFAAKGVSVFELNTSPVPLRLATLHLQAGGDQDTLRVKQFHTAVLFANATGAHVLAGDVNAEHPATLTAMNDLVRMFGGAWVPHDGYPTCCKSLGSGTYGTSGEIARLDHVWILQPAVVRATGVCVANDAVTHGWSDHAAVDVTLQW